MLKRFGSGLIRVIGASSEAGGVIAAAGIILMTFAMTYAAMSRYALNKAPGWSVVGMTFLFVAIGSLSLSYAEKTKTHVTVDIITSRLSQQAKGVIGLIYGGLTIIIVAIIAWYGLDLTRLSYELNRRTLDLMNWPLWVPQLFVPIGCFFFICQLIITVMHSIELMRSAAMRPPHSELSVGRSHDE